MNPKKAPLKLTVQISQVELIHHNFGRFLQTAKS